MKNNQEINLKNNQIDNTKKLSDKYLIELANKLHKTLVEPIKYDRRLIDLGYKPKDLKSN